MSEKLVIDLKKCKSCTLCDVQCSYKHHPANNGINALLEKIRFALICRKCKTAPCIKACPRNALEKVDIGRGDEQVLKRADMLCTGCGTCAIACPFGTVYTELAAFVDDVCDLCRGRLKSNEKPLCVRTCSSGALDWQKIDVEENRDMTEVFDDVVVKVADGDLWEPFLPRSQKASG
jgi:Fe-S-cluster-containing dehydrogenase component